MEKLIQKHQYGGWISQLGREGRLQPRYGSYMRPVQLPEIVVVAPQTYPYDFDRRTVEYPNAKVSSETLLAPYNLHSGEATTTYMGDDTPIRGGRLITQTPKGNDTIYLEPTPRSNNQKDWEGFNSYSGHQWMPYEHGYMYVQPAKNQQQAKETFYKNLPKSKPRNGDNETKNAWKRANKENKKLKKSK